MRAKLLFVLMAASCGSNNQTLDGGHDGPSLDAPESAPMITSYVATPVTWTWTYSNNPSPVPACTVDFVGAITSGTQSTVTQPQARTYRLRCTNSQGSATALATVSVNECADVTAQCNTNATCT